MQQVILLDHSSTSGTVGTMDETWINSDAYKARHKCKFPDLVVKFGNVGEYPC